MFKLSRKRKIFEEKKRKGVRVDSSKVGLSTCERTANDAES